MTTSNKVMTKPAAVLLQTFIDSHIAHVVWQRHFCDRDNDSYHYWMEVEGKLGETSLILTELIDHLNQEGE